MNLPFDKILENTWPLLEFYPSWAKATFTVALASLLASSFIFLVWYSSASAARTAITRDTSLARLATTAKAVKDAPPYVLESVTMIVRLEQAAEHAADIRFVYTLFALREVTEKDFQEEFHGRNETFIARLAGSEPEIANDAVVEVQRTLKRFNVSLKMQPGEHRTIVTGGRYVSTLPLPASRDIHGFKNLSPNTDAWCYPNSTDFIGQLTILVVESDSLAFAQPEAGDAALWEPEKPTRIADELPALYTVDSEGIRRRVVVGRWRDVMPTQTVGLRVRW